MPDEPFNIENVREYARRFRTAIENTPKKDLSIGFFIFPKAACSDTSTLLGIALREANLGEFQFINGRSETHSHAWLELNGIVVDITADQFDAKLPSVYVGELNEWYAQWSIDKQVRKPEINSGDQHNDGELWRSYASLLKTLG